jgi:hypothetical protein
MVRRLGRPDLFLLTGQALRTTAVRLKGCGTFLDVSRALKHHRQGSTVTYPEKFARWVRYGSAEF